jgi:diacylglycerol kinase
MSLPRQQNDVGYQTPLPTSSFVRSFSFAGQGVWHVVRTQRNMRVHLLAAVAAV